MKSDNDPPIARNSDTITSHLAGDKHTESGKRDSWSMRIFGWMDENCIATDDESLTGREISASSGIDNEQMHKRLSDLEKNGFVVKVHIRECRVTGEKAWTWKIRTDYSEKEEVLAELLGNAEQGELF